MKRAIPGRHSCPPASKEAQAAPFVCGRKSTRGWSAAAPLQLRKNEIAIKILILGVKNDDEEIYKTVSGIGGVWYLVFEATEFSPYALVIKNTGSYYDESAGLPYYLDKSDGKVVIGLAANGKYIAPAGVTIAVTPNGKSFTDISGHWGAKYIGFVTGREIFLGTGSDTFSPDAGMTRAMFAPAAGRLYERSFGEIEVQVSSAFTDCDDSNYYGKYVDWAAEKGIMGGYGNGKFGPDDQITREQMAAILYRFADLLDALPNGTDTAPDYPDADSISAYAKDAALYCQTTGIITGRNGSAFAPQETATRAEVATIMQRFVESIVK